ncbi:hypothetical protein [Streptomyces sp. NPDC018711]|uniref:hypothetical protein n=1 Tax=Streptomyces sp. NPDC018711 TaxID=3365052 RepID=UPI0037903395
MGLAQDTQETGRPSGQVLDDGLDVGVGGADGYAEAGGSFKELVEAGEPRIVAGQDNDGYVVFAISLRLSTALADAGHSGLRNVAASWTRSRAEDGEVIDTEIADAIVGGLAALVSSARRQNQSVYCWVA